MTFMFGRHSRHHTNACRIHGHRIGLGLTLIHPISIPVTTSVNPARCCNRPVRQWLGHSQLWLFWLAPIVGAVIAGFAFKALEGSWRNRR